MVRTHLPFSRLAAVAAAALTPFAVPAAASAAGTASVGSGVMTVNGGTGDANSLGINYGTYAGGVWSISAIDNSVRPALQIPVTAGAGCVAAGIFAECSQSGFTSIVVNGNDKNDRLYSNQTDTTLNGGTGDDWLVVHSGDWATQNLNGDAGTDSVSYNGASYAISASIDGTRNDGYLGNGKIGTDVERVVGGANNDTITGSSTIRTTLMGQSGADSITAGSAGSHLYGGKGNDTLTGGNGNDEFTDYVGTDTMTGGDGDDTFHADDTDNADTISCGAGYDIAFVDGAGEISDWGTDGATTTCEQVIYD